MFEFKLVYRTVSKEVALDNLFELQVKWAEKYPVVIDSWECNGEELSQYFDFGPQIRKMIYTTNAVEGFHRQIRKVTKTKGSFTNDMALIKLDYLATKNIEKKWTTPLQNWGLIIQQLYIKFRDRVTIDLATNPPNKIWELVPRSYLGIEYLDKA